MTWNPDFTAAVTAGGQPIEWLIEVVGALTESDGSRGGFYLPARYSSTRAGTARPTLVASSVSVGGQSVTPVSWRFNDLSWSFQITDPDRATAAQVFRRGQLLRLRAGLPGMTDRDYSPITIGRVVSVRESRPGVIDVQCWGPTSALQSRATTNGQRLSIHETYLGSTVSGSPYTAGDSEITVASTAGFEFPTGRYIVVKVTPTSGSDAFYLRGTAISATKVTGLDSSAVLGTTASTAGIGSTVVPIWYDQGRPDVIAARILTSTATNTNGAYDDLPFHWGYGLPSEWVDIPDLIACGTALFTPSSGSFISRWWADPAPADSGGWLTSLLSLHGAWLCTREGRLTLRGSQDITSRGAVLYHSGETITDADVIPKSVAVEWYSRDQNTEYRTASVTSASGSSTTTSGLTVGSLPAYGTYDYDLSGYIYDNESNARQNLLGRSESWIYSIGETVSLDCIGLRLSRLCPGDVVTLASALVSGRLARTVLTYAGGVTAMVTSVAPDWRGGKTSLRLTVLPADRTDSWGP